MLFVVGGAVGTVGLQVHGATETQTAREDKASAESTAVQVAQPLARICAGDPAAARDAGADCGLVTAVAQGQAGAKGDPGRGIVGTAIRADGHLVVTYDDATVNDVGRVVGADGRGIASTVLDGGHLVLVYSDGTRTDLGVVVGPVGNGVASASTAGGRLVLTLDDGTSVDAGPLPKGDTGDKGEKGDTGQEGGPGAPGPAGPACPDGFQPVETGPVVGADGRSYSRSITCVDPTSASTGGDSSSDDTGVGGGG